MDVPFNFATFALAQASLASIPRPGGVSIDADETNGNQRTFYFFDGVRLNRQGRPNRVAGPLLLASQVVMQSTVLTSASPYRTIVNSATATTQTLPASPIADETRVITNVGTGAATVSYIGPGAVAASVVIAPFNTRTFAFNAQLGYWTPDSMHNRATAWADFTPKSGDTVVIPVADAGTTVNVNLNHTALIAALTLQFPVSNVADGQVVMLYSKSPVTLLTMNAETGGALVGLLSALIANATGVYKFRASNKTWYKY